MEHFLQFDREVFYLINEGLSNPFFDWILPIIRDKHTWIPLYVFLIAFMFFNFDWKKAVIIIIGVFLTFGAADQMSSQIVKKSVERPRPCHEESGLEGRLLVHCGSGYSFTSSHATNHMAIALFLALTAFRRWKPAQISLIAWAVSVAYAQVYVGVHYPIDVIFGFILGSFIAICVYLIYERVVSYLFPKEN